MSVEDAIEQGLLPISHIRVRTDGKYPEILDRRLKGNAETVLELQRGSMGQEGGETILQPVAVPSA